jgi:hypothetical protein
MLILSSLDNFIAIGTLLTGPSFMNIVAVPLDTSACFSCYFEISRSHSTTYSVFMYIISNEALNVPKDLNFGI